MPDTFALASVPATPIDLVLTAVAASLTGSEGMRMILARQSEFTSLLQAQLTGIALDPAGRQIAEQVLDTYWSDEDRRQALLAGSTGREVLIGSGFHAAVYAATRVLAGYPKPLVLERADRVGGTFAMTSRPTFYLNSRNRPGGPGLAGDLGASLNYLPGAPIQAANVSMREFQTNLDMALVIRFTLAQYADVVTAATVGSVISDGTGVQIDLDNRGLLSAARVIDARGLGDPLQQKLLNSSTILSFAQFMARMATAWPLRGVRRAAVIGGGDSAKCAVESFLGIAPQPFMAATGLDQVERIDWYTDSLPTTCQDWQEQERGRYQGIGRYLRPDRNGVQRLNMIIRQARPVALPGTVLIGGRTYDLAIACTGNQETNIDGLDSGFFDNHAGPDGTVIATRHFNQPMFRVGPHARLPFTDREREDGIADIPANAVSIFRTATKTAALAASLSPA